MKKIIRNLGLDEKGQILPLMALGIAVFLGFAAITVDYGYLAWQKRELQNAADAGALASAWELPSGVDVDSTIYENNNDIPETVGGINTVDHVAMTYANKHIEDSFVDAVVSADKTQVTVMVEKRYDRLFGRIFTIFDKDAPTSDLISADATADIGKVDLLPIADIDTYKDMTIKDAKRTEENDPFYYWMQGRNLTWYNTFLDRRISGGADITGDYDFTIKAQNKNEVDQDIEVDITLKFTEYPDPEDSERKIITTQLIMSGTREYTDDDGNLVSEPINYPSRDLINGGTKISFREAAQGVSGNIGFLDLTMYSDYSQIKDVLLEGLNTRIMEESAPDPINIWTQPGSIMAVEQDQAKPLQTRLEENDYEGFVLGFLPSSVSGLTGKTLVDWGNFVLLYVVDLDLTGDSDEPLTGKIAGVWNVYAGEYPEFTDDLYDIRPKLVE